MNYPALTFEAPDTKTFRNLALAFEAMKRGGNAPCILNAANEIVVDAFLKNKVKFLEMSDIIERCMSDVKFVAAPSLEDYMETDRASRELANEIILKTLSV